MFQWSCNLRNVKLTELFEKHCFTMFITALCVSFLMNMLPSFQNETFGFKRNCVAESMGKADTKTGVDKGR